ncbi:MAG: hypothetical protein PUF44_04620 [Bacteroidales bacterium]|nr:hypothetical protein [Bacteroidales bacterium]
MCLVLVLALSAGLSLNAQTTWYSPGTRLGIDQINVDDCVFIYSMCYVDGSASSDYSRFIVNDGNSAKAGVGKPATLHTQNNGYVWKVRSKEPVSRTVTEGTSSEQVTYTGVQLTFSRNAGSETTTYYWGIGSVTNNTTAGDAQKMVVTQWMSDPYVSGATKSGTDVYLEDVNGNIISQDALTSDDKVYLVSALTGKSVNTANGNYQSGNANGYPVAFYSVTTSDTAPADPLSIHISAAPDNSTGTTIWSEGTKWYKLKTNSGSWRYVDTNHAYCDASGNFQLNKTASSDALSALWAVEGNETDGYKFYNMATGPGKVLGITGSEAGARTKMVNKDNPGENVTTAFDITYHYDGNWYIKKHGTTNNYLNYRDGNLALWDSSAGLGNPGSAFKFEAVDDVTTYVTAAQAKIVGLAEDWKNMPAIWAEATATYDALNVTLSNPVTNAEIVAAAEAQAAAREAFVSAVNNQKVTLSNYDSNSGASARYNAAMYVDNSSTTVKGRTPAAITLDEVMVLKATPDFTIKIYNAQTDKYVGTPGGNATSAVALASAGNFDIYTEASKGQNVAVFRVNGTATMHLLGGLNISNYNSTTDVASYWRFSTDVSRHELKAGIENATTWKDNLSALLEAKKANLLQEPASLYKITEEIRIANLALNDASGTQATRTAALATLNAALTKAQGAWLGELGATQEFRLRNNAITTTTGEGESAVTTSYYLIVGQEKNSGSNDNAREGNARLAALDENSTNQKFTLTPGTGSNAGKYVLTFGDSQLKDLGGWNTDMTTGSDGTPYSFEEVDLAEGLFRIRTTQGLFGPNDGVTGDNLTTGKNAFMYTNHTGTRDNLTWVLEFIAPTADADKTALAAEIAKAPTWLDDANLINPDGIGCVAGYKAAKEAAEAVNSNDAATVYEVNTALQRLKAQWDFLVNRFFIEASPAQGYRLKFNSNANLYMTFTPDVTETLEANVMNVQAASNAAKQTVKIQPAAEEGKFTIQEGATSKNVGISSYIYWNPSLVDAAGATFTFEPVTIDNSDYLAVKIKSSEGVLAPGSDAPAANAYVYTNQGSDVARYWIVEPYVSPDSVNALKAAIAKTEIYLGSKVGQYVSAINVAPLNSVSQSMVDYTGDYADMPLTNTLYYNQIAQYDNVFTSTNLRINQPTAGRVYRFKGKVSGKYMCAATATPTSSTDTKMTMVADSTQLGTLFILQTGEEIDGLQGFKFLSYNTGYYTKNTHNNGALSAAANSVKVYASETAANLGYYTLKSNRAGDTAGGSIGTYLYDNGTVVDRNGSYTANNCDWTIEEVTELPISVTTGYSRLGTIVSPVSLNADNSKLKFYTGSINGDYLHLTEFTGGVIPAGVPFLIEYQGGDQTNGCSLLEVNGAEATLDGGVENALRGGLETVATPTDIGTIYTIQKTGSAPETDTQVFRRYTGDTVKGCRAYLPLPTGSNIKGMVFDDGTTTEIETLVEPAAPAAPAACYDLSGRRVAKAGKGLYIRDGKKVFVK